MGRHTNNVPTKLGDLIMRRRGHLGKSQPQMTARLAELGYPYSTTQWGHWERGESVLPLFEVKFLQALASTLEISPQELLEAAGFGDIIQFEPTHSVRALALASLFDSLSEDRQDLVMFLVDDIRAYESSLRLSPKKPRRRTTPERKSDARSSTTGSRSRNPP